MIDKKKIITTTICLIIILFIFVINYPFPINMKVRGLEIDIANKNHIIEREIQINGRYYVNLFARGAVDKFIGKIEISGYEDKIKKEWEMAPVNIGGGHLSFYIKEKKEKYELCNADIDRFMQNMVFWFGDTLSADEGRLVVTGAKTREEAMQILVKKYKGIFYEDDIEKR